MVIDASAIVAIMLGEPERARFSRAVLSQPIRLTSAPTLFEATMVVLGRKGEPGVAELDAFIEKVGIETVPFTAEQVGLAVAAFRRFGKGRHPAGLNFGDCFSYALAKATAEPLLFKGDDFAKTDIVPAL